MAAIIADNHHRYLLDVAVQLLSRVCSPSVEREGAIAGVWLRWIENAVRNVPPAARW